LTALAAEALRRAPRSAGEWRSVSRFGSRPGSRPSGQRRHRNLSNVPGARADDRITSRQTQPANARVRDGRIYATATCSGVGLRIRRRAVRAL